MALLTKVGSFALPAATGTQAITGVGFTPKVIIFWSTGSDKAAGTWSNGVYSMMGFTTGSANSYAVSAASQSLITGSNTGRSAAAKAITFIDVNGTTTYQEADLQSFDADGFTLNYTTHVAGIDGTAVNYLALGGTDITNAKIVTYSGAGAAGVQAVTGVGFKPDLVLHFLNGLTAGTHGSVFRTIFGAMNKHGQQWTNSTTASDGTNPTDTARGQQTDACIVFTDTGATTIQGEAQYASMDTDGFSINWVTAGGAPGYALCIKGISSRVGAFLKSGGTAPAVTTVPHVGFLPKALLMTTNGNPPQGGTTANGTWGLGATDLTNHRTAYYTDGDALATSAAQCVQYTDAPIITHNGLGVTGGKVTQVYADSDHPDRFSLYFNANDSTNGEILYLALGDAGTNTYPVTVG